MSGTPQRRSAGELGGLLVSAVRLARRADSRSLTATFVIQVVAGFGAAVQLLVARELLDVVIEGEGSMSSAVPWLLALVATTTALGFAAVVQATLGLVLGEAVSRCATGQVLDVAVAVEPIVWEDPDFHDRLERARTNAASRPVMVVNGLTGVLGATAGAVGVAVALVAIEPLLVPLAAIGVLPALVATGNNSRHHHRFARAQTADDRRRSYLLHLLTSRELAKELRVYRNAGELRRRHDALHEERLDRIRALARQRRRSSLLAAVGGAIGTLASVGYLLWSVDRGRLDVPSAGAALFSLLFLAQRLRALAAGAGALYEAGLFLEEVEEFHRLAADPAIVRPDAATAPPLPAFERLTVRGLRFSYPDAAHPAVDGVDLDLEAGEVVALVGENGSGKTTLAKILSGLYEADEGSLRWDAVELGCGGRDTIALRHSVAVVFQDHVKYQLSAADNVGLGDIDRLGDRAAIEAAGRAAGADEFVAELPGGWDQLLSRLFEGGVDLSGGQWQRLALARALFRDAPFVILDEPSSALDARAEARLFERFRELVGGRSAVFISHRFSTVRLADRIYVLHEGRVVEHGTHEELLAVGGQYAELYRLQAAAYLVEPTEI